MAQYTIEDIEILRQKSGISYEEAVNLLEYHNGSLARALVDLEKNGRIRDAKSAAGTHRRGGHRFFNTMFRIRFRLTKGSIPIVNLSVLFMILMLLIAPQAVVIGAVMALVLGYRFSIERNSESFTEESLEDMLKHAGTNVRNTVFTIAKDLGATSQGKPEAGADAQPSAPEQRTETPASGTTPVNVQFPEEGNVHVTETRDGYHEADIR